MAIRLRPNYIILNANRKEICQHADLAIHADDTRRAKTHRGYAQER